MTHDPIKFEWASLWRGKKDKQQQYKQNNKQGFSQIVIEFKLLQYKFTITYVDHVNNKGMYIYINAWNNITNETQCKLNHLSRSRCLEFWKATTTRVTRKAYAEEGIFCTSFPTPGMPSVLFFVTNATVGATTKVTNGTLPVTVTNA